MTPQDYVIHYAPLLRTLQAIDVQALIDQVEEPWYDQTLIQVGDVLVRLGVLSGEFRTAVLMIEKAGVVATGD